ncbi:MAG: acyl-CoA/acyl-ACP dehydrogenase, partial [Syntrophales bacterium]|nr:acyl-CoA/acyl-ACP dehydrogenase [Syntrophales bacterium]
MDAAMVREACEGILKRFDRKYMVSCLREHRFPTELYECMLDVGITKRGVPEEYGGVGGGMKEMVTAVEILARQGMTNGYWILTALIRRLLLMFGTQEQIQKFVVPATSGVIRFFSLAVTEPNAGTNTFKITTKARRTEKGTYILNGQKVFITGFKDADYALVVTRTQSHGDSEDRTAGLSIFIVDPKAPGVEATPLNINVHATDHQYQVFFTDVELPADALVGKEGEGGKYMFHALNVERLLLSAQSIEMGEWILAKGVEYAKIRAPFDAPIGSYQSIQHPMAYAKVHLEAARLMLHRAVELYDQGGKYGTEANMAKLLATDALFEAANITAQCHGGYAFDTDYDILDTLVLARLQQIAPVNNSTLLNYVGE